MKFIFTRTHNLTNMYPSVKNMYDHSFRTVCKTTCHLDDDCAVSSMGIFSLRTHKPLWHTNYNIDY